MKVVVETLALQPCKVCSARAHWNFQSDRVVIMPEMPGIHRFSFPSHRSKTALRFP